MANMAVSLSHSRRCSHRSTNLHPDFASKPSVLNDHPRSEFTRTSLHRNCTLVNMPRPPFVSRLKVSQSPWACARPSDRHSRGTRTLYWIRAGRRTLTGIGVASSSPQANITSTHRRIFLQCATQPRVALVICLILYKPVSLYNFNYASTVIYNALAIARAI